jgi:hypothetical protein
MEKGVNLSPSLVRPQDRTAFRSPVHQELESFPASVVMGKPEGPPSDVKMKVEVSASFGSTKKSEHKVYFGLVRSVLGRGQ